MNKFRKNNDNNSDFDANKATSKSNISELEDGAYFNGTVKILRKAKPGPVVFSVSDGSGVIDAVIKDSEFEMDEVVKISGPVTERAGRLQIEISKTEKTEMDFDSVLEEKSKPVRTDFSIQSDRFEKMKPHFIRIATRIRKAILNNQPIIIRHHNDSDGIVSGLSIEQSCKNLMKKIGVNTDYNLYRSPSKAPFYETSDVFRDLAMTKRLTEGHGQKNPLVLVLDNGSTPEDSFAFKMLKILGYDAIVIDHHNPVIMDEKGNTSVCPYLLDHMNPYKYGLDSQTSAGMLCYEMGRMIDEEFSNPIMPAVAAIADRCNISETDRYIENSGKTKEELTKIGVAIDFTAYNFKFDPGKGVFEEMFKQPELVDIINTKVIEGSETQLQSTMPYLRTQEINGIVFSHIDLEKYTLRFTYPTPGKVIGMIHDKIAEGKEKPVLTIGYVSDMIIIRATKPVLPVQKIIENLRKDLPEANVDGGGHEMAGTIKFVSAHLTEIVERIKKMLKEVSELEE